MTKGKGVKGRIDKKMVKELREIFPLEAPKTKKLLKDVPIIFDGRQYAIRIPKQIAESLDIDLKKDRFHFEATIPPLHAEDNVPKLKGELVRG